jgi:L-fuconolactonase
VARVIDAHHLVWGPARTSWLRGLPIDRAFGMHDFRAASERSGVDGGILVEFAGSDARTDELLAIRRQDPGVLGIIGWVDLTDPLVGHRLDEIGPELNGVRLGVEGDGDGGWYHRPELRRGLVEVERLGLSFDLLVRRPQRADAAAVARDLPGLRFVLDHAGKPEIEEGEWETWLADLRSFAALDNVTCKLSGLVTEASWTGWRGQDLARYFDAALEAFGPERCMWASDWPICLLAASYTEVFDFAQERLAGLTGPERDAVMGGTAERVYRL